MSDLKPWFSEEVLREVPVLVSEAISMLLSQRRDIDHIIDVERIVCRELHWYTAVSQMRPKSARDLLLAFIQIDGTMNLSTSQFENKIAACLYAAQMYGGFVPTRPAYI